LRITAAWPRIVWRRTRLARCRCLNAAAFRGCGSGDAMFTFEIRHWLELAAATDDNRPVLSFIHSEPRKKKPGTWLVALDGYRAHMYIDPANAFGKTNHPTHKCTPNTIRQRDVLEYPNWRLLLKSRKAMNGSVIVDREEVLGKLEDICNYNDVNVWLAFDANHQRLVLYSCTFEVFASLPVALPVRPQQKESFGPYLVNCDYLLEALQMPGVGTIRVGVAQQRAPSFKHPVIIIESLGENRMYAFLMPLSPHLQGETDYQRETAQTAKDRIDILLDTVIL
jgi:hypothetical protein